ncbi:hypothetical protein chiPu_0030974 [Chiloscyllium punctatum]|uniref:VWFD domain-containing protein n=1 Tax=Chiloscyllium punctatum TaxID=137246 RepID=A0A401TVI5_CHIPU|nr:hypothetical protein [Chiloscyllium punctatum]
MVTVTQEGNAVVLRTQFGLRVVYDALSYLEVNVSSSYQGQLAGLCGNYNGDQNDDLLLPTGEGAANLMEFATSWKVQTAGGACPVSSYPLAPGCDAHQQQIYSTPNFCGLLTDSSGPFAACAQMVEPSTFYQSCLYDVCTANGSHQALCRNLQGYATACQQAGGQLHPWRDSNFCRK